MSYLGNGNRQRNNHVAHIMNDNHKKLFLGKAGEYRVVSELLLRGYNANMLPMDAGVDIMAEKDSMFYQFQVRTSSYSSVGNSFILQLPHLKSLNVVVVIFGREFNEIVVLPPRIVAKISKPYIRMSFTRKDGVTRAFLNGRKHEVTPYLCAFDLAEPMAKNRQKG